MNVIWFVLDTLRADHLSCYGYFRRTSPNLDGWRKKACYLKTRTHRRSRQVFNEPNARRQGMLADGSPAELPEKFCPQIQEAGSRLVIISRRSEKCRVTDLADRLVN